MKIHGNEITVHRGETFTIDFSFVNKDDSPYVVSNRVDNPYILIAVTDSKFMVADRYIKNYWLNLSNWHKFYYTRVLDIRSFMSESEDGTQLYNSFADLVDPQDSTLYTLPQGWVDGNQVTCSGDIDLASVTRTTWKSTVGNEDYYNGYVFCGPGADGTTAYKYFAFDNFAASASGLYTTYDCRIIKTFLQDDTAKWVEQNYFYSINFVAGTLVHDYLLNKAAVYNMENPDTPIEYYNDSSNIELYTLLAMNGVNFPDTFSPAQPIGNPDFDLPILQPTRLTVLANLNGGM